MTISQQAAGPGHDLKQWSAAIIFLGTVVSDVTRLATTQLSVAMIVFRAHNHKPTTHNKKTIIYHHLLLIPLIFPFYQKLLELEQRMEMETAEVVCCDLTN